MTTSEVGWLTLSTGRFTMGTDDDSMPADEGPRRDVTTATFSISAEPVTVPEFAAFVASTGFETVADREGNGFVGTESTLVDGANWRSPFGLNDEPRPDPKDRKGVPVLQVAWSDAMAYCEWSDTRLPTEAEWERAAGEWDTLRTDGLWQWCLDWYDASFHLTEQRVNPTGPTSGTHRVVRGGSPRLTERLGLLPDMSSTTLGFRVVTRR
ncbi:MAG: formylglycine-generating enzyme family protein [Acidimicrobiales bacterium]